MVNLVDNVTEMVRLFTEVAAANPGSAVLLLVGTVLIGFSTLFFGYLTIGALTAGLLPDGPGRAPPQRD